MQLVVYPDSESENDQDSENGPAKRQAAPSALINAGTTKKRKLSTIPASELPPLPAAFHDLYATDVRTAGSDDPALHGGRKRQTPHVEGNWPTHVYLEWHPTADEAQLLQNMITQLTKSSLDVHTLLHSDLGASLPLHISLSRSLSLHTNEREDFLASLRQHIQGSRVKQFEIRFNRVAWYPNYERNRWFLSLGAEKPKGNEMNRLLHASNKACHLMNQPELYVSQRHSEGERVSKVVKRARVGDEMKPIDAKVKNNTAMLDCSKSFHVSLAWSLNEQVDGEHGFEQLSEELRTLSVSFDCVKVKIGNIVTSLDLKPSGTRKGSLS